jgi:hypothetical protein
MIRPLIQAWRSRSISCRNRIGGMPNDSAPLLLSDQRVDGGQLARQIGTEMVAGSYRGGP